MRKPDIFPIRMYRKRDNSRNCDVTLRLEIFRSQGSSLSKSHFVMQPQASNARKRVTKPTTVTTELYVDQTSQKKNERIYPPYQVKKLKLFFKWSRRFRHQCLGVSKPNRQLLIQSLGQARPQLCQIVPFTQIGLEVVELN